MKRFLTFLALWATIFFYTNAIPNLVLLGCNPKDGSDIDSFSFDLEFDLSEIYSIYGYSDDFGIGIGASSKYGFKLYRGESTSGDLLQTIYNYNVDGLHDEFQVGPKLHFDFDNKFLTDGETYTIAISAILSCQKKGYENVINTTSLDYRRNPVTYTFKAHTNENNFNLRDWSIEAESDYNKIPDIIDISFTKEISIDENAKADVYIIYDGPYASNIESFYKSVNISVNQSEPSTILIDTGGFAMYNGWKYKIVIPEGLVYEKDNPDNKHPQISRTLIGNAQEYFTAEAIEPIINDIGVVDAVKITWNSPDSSQYAVQTSTGSTGSGGGFALSISNIPEGGNSEEKMISCLTDQNGEWPTMTYKLVSGLMPSTTYYLYKKMGEVNGFLKDLGLCPGLVNAELNLEFGTPSIDSAVGVPEIKYNYLGEFDESTINELKRLEDGYYADNIGTVEIEIEDYKYNGKSYDIYPYNYKTLKGEFYEVTEDGDVLLKKINLGTNKRGSNGLFLKNTLVCYVDMSLDDGKNYKLVIPENAVYSSAPKVGFYAKSPRFEFNFKGSDNTTTVNELYIPGNNIKVFKEGISTLVIEGVTIKDTIDIYNTTGIVIKTIQPQDGKDQIRVSVVPGQTYIVRIGEYGTKIQF